MKPEELNPLVRRIWRLMVAREVNDAEAMEVVLRLMASVALATAGGDPKKAVAVIESATGDMITAIRTGRVKVSEVVHSSEPTAGATHQ